MSIGPRQPSPEEEWRILDATDRGRQEVARDFAQMLILRADAEGNGTLAHRIILAYREWSGDKEWLP